ncbi:MAG: sensor histidine kinase [Planctomycetota bacterium]|jgi:K+-sensing histidine kinase KdpD
MVALSKRLAPTANRRDRDSELPARAVDVIAQAMRDSHGSPDLGRQLLLEAAVDLTGAQRGAIVLKSANEIQVSDYLESASAPAKQISSSLSWAIAARVIATGDPVIHQDALSSEELASHRSVSELGLRSVACVPIGMGAELRGALYVDHRGVAGRFSSSDTACLSLISECIGLCMRLEASAENEGSYAEAAASAREMALRAERNRVAGELAAGITHDLKNVLSAISARSQLISQGESEGRIQKQLKAIESAALSGAQLLGRLQECTRDHTRQPREPVSLLRVIGEALELAEHKLSSGVEGGVRVTLHDLRQDVAVEAVPGELREMFLNLVLNACDAMPTGGEIQISFEVIDSQGDGPPEAVVVDVADSGEGISEELLPRVFEPFFTTKGGDGTGLGLVVVRDVVLRAGGTIDVASNVGQGTTFRLRFPAVSRAPSPMAARPQGMQ